jgi:hypothetical protein
MNIAPIRAKREKNIPERGIVESFIFPRGFPAVAGALPRAWIFRKYIT